ncbi:T9SS type A sorting domain-containing protein [Mangrovimonas futianensis]|uniref:T9SS type A sorting domain-containing protein n=1 Tax=Mangrovimonas futianensis TaxID=2895523 RepID=UPI001E2824FE|nr:T9SS type A sorting domain-containing protein [Mangrovimonas futianensis]MCF1421896.1 T9SS type A sorting domain-containing protein [Mangrovimonas futianensis]
MKKKLLYFSLFGLFSFSQSLMAQTYEPLVITGGYNQDIVANGAGTAMSSSTIAADDANFCFMSNDFDPTGSTSLTDALPNSGTFTSQANSELPFLFADYGASNALRITGTGSTGTLTFSNTLEASKLFILGTSGSGTSNFDVEVTFDDATSESFTGQLLPDWFYSTTQPVALSGFGRVNRTTDAIEEYASEPRLYQIELEISTANQVKTIESIIITKASGGGANGVINIMGVTAELAPSCINANTLAATTGVDDATITWEASPSSPGLPYDYYLTTGTETPDVSTTPTGTIPTTENALDLTELEIGTTYYFWIRTNCSAEDATDWDMVSFTTGQMSFTYDSGDIETLYGTPTTSSTSSCPGAMTISVPEGYEISNITLDYEMTAAAGAWMSEQRSFLICTTSGATESSVATGASNSGGTFTYHREGIDIANGLSGDVDFELHAWRTWGGSGCGTNYNRVNNNTWKITITYGPSLTTDEHELAGFSVYPNPTNDLIYVKSLTSLNSLSIYNLMGQEVMNTNDVKSSEGIDISHLTSGTYLLKVIGSNGESFTKRIIKN